MYRAFIISLCVVFTGCAYQTKQVQRSSISNVDVQAFLDRLGPASPRLSTVSAFPQEHQAAAVATIAAVEAKGGTAEEYFATITSAADGSIEVYLTHRSCPPLQKGTVRGDPCGRCRVTYFYPKEGRLSALGILQ
jgi:hypothetical protein